MVKAELHECKYYVDANRTSLPTNPVSFTVARSSIVNVTLGLVSKSTKTVHAKRASLINCDSSIYRGSFSSTPSLSV